MSKTAGSTCSPYSMSVASFCIESIAQYCYIFYHTSPKIRDHKATLGHRDFRINKCGKHIHTTLRAMCRGISHFYCIFNSCSKFLLVFLKLSHRDKKNL